MKKYASVLLNPVWIILCLISAVGGTYGAEPVSDNAKLIVQEAMAMPNDDTFRYALQRISEMDSETMRHAVNVLSNRLGEVQGKNVTIAALRLFRRLKQPLAEPVHAWTIAQSKSEIDDVRDVATDLLAFQSVVAEEARQGPVPGVDKKRILDEFSADLEKQILDPRLIAQLADVEQDKTSKLVDVAIELNQKSSWSPTVRLNLLRILERYTKRPNDLQMAFVMSCMKDNDPLVAGVAKNAKIQIEKTTE